MLRKIKNFLLNNTSTGQTVMKNTIWLTISTAAGKLIRSLMVIYAARALGAGEYGIFSYALGLVSMFSLFADIGLTPLLVKDLIRKTGDNKTRYVSAIISVKFVLLLFSFLLVVVLAPLTSNFSEATSLLPFVALLVLFDNLRGFGFSLLRAENRMEKEARIDIGIELFTAIIGFAILIVNPTVKNLVLGYLVGSGLGAVLAISMMKNYIRNLWISIKRPIIIDVIMSALPYALVGIFSTLMTNIDIFIIGEFLNPSAVGLYAAALRPIGLLYLLPGFLSSAIFPIMNRMSAHHDEFGLKNVAELAMTATLALAIPIAVGGTIIGGSLVHNIFGADYSGSIVSFKILLWSIIPIFPGMILMHLLLSKGIRKAPIKATAVGAVVNVILDIILIPSHGIGGSAIATLIAQLAMNGILFHETRKFLKLSPFHKMGTIILSSAIMGAVVYLLITGGVNSLIVMTIGVISYILSLRIMKDPLLMKAIGIIRGS